MKDYIPEYSIEEHEIFNAFPRLFSNVGLPASKSAMAWGIETPKSWYTIICGACNVLESSFARPLHPTYDYSNNIVTPDYHIVARQIKEKFNELRFYYDIAGGQLYEQYANKDVIMQTKHAFASFADGVIMMATDQINSKFN